MSSRKDIMLATMFDEKRFNAMPKPVFVQPKIEGDRLRVVIKDGRINMLTSIGNERLSVPHIKKDITILGWDNIELDGELYKHGMPHNEIRSRVGRTKNLHPDYSSIEYHLFDIITPDMQFQRIKDLRNLQNNLTNCESLTVVPTVLTHTLEELQEIYDECLRQKYEGIIIRHPYANYVRRKVSTILKLKPRVSEYFTIVGIVEEKSLEGERKGVFGAFQLTTDDNEFFNAGSGPTAYQRVLLWRHRRSLIDTKVKIRFQGYSTVRKVPELLSIDKEWLINIQTKLEE